jgi:hypothetical protein
MKAATSSASLLGRVDARRVVAFSGSAKIERNACEVFRVLADLKCIACVIGGQIRDQDDRLSGPLLLVVQGEIAGFDLGHGSSFLPG